MVATHTFFFALAHPTLLWSQEVVLNGAFEDKGVTMLEPIVSPPQPPVENELCLTARSRAEVLAQVAREVAAPCPELDAAVIQAALQAREDAQSTEIGEGLAVPHAVLADLDQPRTLSVTFEHPVPWGEGGGEVERCVVILVPPGRERAHLGLVAQAVRTHRGE